MTRAYYNEFDPGAAAWLRELIKRGLIADGDVDERSIEDVRPDELRGYTQCHFFAGIGGWAYALDLAGWPRDRPVWTGSCPCQPFSAAGKGDGFADERHLWPAWQHLIAQCRPPVVLGEQVASKIADSWVDLVHADLEGMGYAFGCVPFPSAGIGAPHIRDRNYWVAHAHDAGLEGRRISAERAAECLARASSLAGGLANQASVMADANGGPCHEGNPIAGGRDSRGDAESRPGPGGDGLSGVASAVNGFWRDADWLGCTDGKWRPVGPGTFPLAHGLPARVVRLRGYGNAINPYAAEAFIRAFEEAVTPVSLAEAAA